MLNNITKKVKPYFQNYKFYNVIYVFFVILGIFLRIKHYFENRSLWLDEIYPAVRIVNRSFADIWSNVQIFPEFAQQPLLFVYVEKFFVSLFGNSGYALRFFPLISSICAIILFAIYLRNSFNKKTSFIAMAFFSIAESIVYFSSEVKQYSSDILITILLMILFDQFINRRFSKKQLILLIFISFTSLWISNSSLFILAGFLSVILFFSVMNRDWFRLQSTLLLSASAMVSFILLYMTFLKKMVGNSQINRTWIGAFAPDRIFSLETVIWSKTVILGAFKNPMGLTFLPAFAFILLILGWCFRYKKNPQQAVMWGAVLLLTFIAALIQKYPFRGRVLLFLYPIVIVLFAEGLSGIRFKNTTVTKVAMVVLVIALMWPSCVEAYTKFRNGRERYKNRQYIAFLMHHYKPGDVFLFNTSGHIIFLYYVNQLGYFDGLKTGKCLEGVNKIRKCFSSWDLSPFTFNKMGKEYVGFRENVDFFNKKGFYYKSMQKTSVNDLKFAALDDKIPFSGINRLWVVLLTITDNYHSEILSMLDRTGKRLKSIEGFESGVYLYDLKK